MNLESQVLKMFALVFNHCEEKTNTFSPPNAHRKVVSGIAIKIDLCCASIRKLDNTFMILVQITQNCHIFAFDRLLIWMILSPHGPTVDGRNPANQLIW